MTGAPSHRRHRPAHRGVFVSLFVSDSIMEKAAKGVTVFDLSGAGFGLWTTGSAKIEVVGTLFVLAQFIKTPPGRYELRLEIHLENGVRQVLNEHVSDIPNEFHSLSYGVDLTGIILPIGMHYAWAYVQNEPKAVAILRVLGPDDMPLRDEPGRSTSNDP